MKRFALRARRFLRTRGLTAEVERPYDTVMTDVTVRVSGHRGEPLVITRHDRCEHVLDALFDDIVLAGLKRVEITRETIKMSFANEPAASLVRERLLQLLGRPRWVVGQE